MGDLFHLWGSRILLETDYEIAHLVRKAPLLLENLDLTFGRKGNLDFSPIYFIICQGTLVRARICLGLGIVGIH